MRIHLRKDGKPFPFLRKKRGPIEDTTLVLILGAYACILAVACPIRARAQVWVDLHGYDKSGAVQVEGEGPLLAVKWVGEQGHRLRLRLNLENPKLFIRDVSFAKGSSFVPVLENASPQYMCLSGKREGYWDNFMDTPAKRGKEIRIAESSLNWAWPAHPLVSVTSDQQRVQVAADGLEIGTFRGKLVFTFFPGSNLVQQEAVVQTSEPDVAYYYDAWLTHCSTKTLKTLAWLDTEGTLIRHPLASDIDLDEVELPVQRRTIIAEGPHGSIGVFPPPHQFFFARDDTTNLKYVWYRLYTRSEEEDFFSFGIRQAPEGGAQHSPLYNAPPGTEQRLKVYYYLSPGSAEDALRGVSTYTHNDSFKALPGYQTFSSHYHLGLAAASIARGRKPYRPEVVDVFKRMGVKIVHLHEFHIDGHPFSPTPKRLEEQKVLYEECARLSDPNFLLTPGEEGLRYFGGHWSVLFPKPIYWYWVRSEGQPFESREEPYGTVYRVGSAADMYELVRKEKGLVWQTHARTKGSRYYPDRLIQQDYYQDPRWLGATFKSMPTDLSSPRLGDRALNLLDDMNNWGGRRFLVGEIDVFHIDHTHELYGHMNINYLRLAQVPRFPEWGEVLDALMRGDFFVSTGEVLIRGFQVAGKRSGEILKLASSGQVEIQADVEWTFPLNFVELVWGNGKDVDRLVVPAADTSQFGQKVFRFSRDLRGVKWIRFAAWDVAANGAFTQPVYVQEAP